jgi:transcription elongation factor Elf1
METQMFTVGDRTDKFCTRCGDERGHIVTSVNKRGQISRVTCSKCDTVSTFQLAAQTAPRPATKVPSRYDRTITYRAGQSMTHEMFGIGEVTRLIEPRKMEVLFQDRLRRLIHAQGHE